MANRTPKSQWAALFNFAGGGLLHLELFLPIGGGVAGQTLLEWIASQILLRGTHAARPSAAVVTIGAEYYETDTKNRFKSDGANWLADGQSGAATINRAVITLSDAQIKALPTTPFELIAAPGAGKTIMPVMVSAEFAWTANYTNIDATAILGPTWNDGVAILTSLRESFDSGVNNLLANDESMTAVFGYGPSITGAPDAVARWLQTSALTNKKLTLSLYNAAAGNLTGGNAANTLTLTIDYELIEA